MGSKTTVVNKRFDEFDVYIGRPSCWGNPFTHLNAGTMAQFKVATREESIEAYRKWIMTQPQLLAQLPSLKGRRLGCFCKPLPCHGDILVELADACVEEGPAPVVDGFGDSDDD